MRPAELRLVARDLQFIRTADCKADSQNAQQVAQCRAIPPESSVDPKLGRLVCLSEAARRAAPRFAE